MHLNRHGVSNERLLIERFSSPMLALAPQRKQVARPLDAIHVLHLNSDAANRLQFENYHLVHYLPLELRRWLTTRFQ